MIAEVAREQGAALAVSAGSNDLPAFAAALGAWSRDGAILPR